MELFESQELLRSIPDFIVKLVAAIVCGGILGLEREATGKSAGLRTGILVCIGAMVFTLLSVEMAKAFGGDSTRIAAQIITGVGFLGAGAIMHDSGRGITGLTTAATIWLLAAIGMMIGAGFMLGALGVTTTSVVLILVLQRFEFYIHRRRSKAYAFEVRENPTALDRVKMLATIYHINLIDFTITAAHSKTIIKFRFAGSNDECYDFLQRLHRIEGVFLYEIPE